MQRRILQLAILALLAASTLQAGPGHRMHHREGSGFDFAEHHLDRMREVLDLSEAQQQQVQAILEANRVRRQAHREEMLARHERLEALLAGDAPDAAEVGSLVIDLHQRRTQLHERNQQVRAEIEALLTAEQRQKIELMSEMRAEHREHRKHLRHERRLMHERHHDAAESEADDQPR